MDGLTIKLLVSTLAIGVIIICCIVWSLGRQLHKVQKDLWEKN